MYFVTGRCFIVGLLVDRSWAESIGNCSGVKLPSVTTYLHFTEHTACMSYLNSYQQLCH
uniref:Uncharacterized protein n=1 Tax=Anguilla anguilla TaxID=7936 RepID=A0A0E9QQV7_ANGAN